MSDKVRDLEATLIKMVIARDQMRHEAAEANASIDMRAALHKADVHLSAAIEQLTLEIARMYH